MQGNNSDSLKAFSYIRLREAATSFRKLSEAYEDLIDGQDRMDVSKGQLLATANMLEKFCGENTISIALEKSHKKEIVRGLLSKGIRAKDISAFESANGKCSLMVLAKRMRGKCVTTREMAQIISEYFEENYVSSQENRNTVGIDYGIYNFYQLPRYKLIAECSQCPATGNGVSGDSFTLTELECGKMLLSIVDGMGTGSVAHRTSMQAVELVEYFLEAGFDEESTIAMINGAFALDRSGENTLAVDIGIVDADLGVLYCLKMGAVATYIKRDGWVEIIKSTTLPIGILADVDCDRSVKKLYDGDFVIMVSDGILENLPGTDKEIQLLDIIQDINSRNPKQLAIAIRDRAIKEGDGYAKDDCTVLVAGVYKI